MKKKQIKLLEEELLEILDKEDLTDEDLDSIRNHFVEGNYSVNCDDYHAHGYSCVDFRTKEVATIEKLIREIKYIRREIKKLVKNIL